MSRIAGYCLRFIGGGGDRPPRRDRRLFTRLAAVVLLTATAPVSAAHDSSIAFTAAERAWLAAHPVIRLGVDPDFAPYAFFDAHGQSVGIAAELTALVGERLGVRLELVPGLTWPQILQAARDREIDVITTATYRPERLEYLRFTRPYLITPLVVMTRVETPTLRDLGKLNGLTVALVKEYASTRTALERFPGINAVLVDNPLAGLNAVSAGRAEAYIGVLGINTYLASRHGISNLKVNTGFDMMNTQSYGVRKDWPELVSLLEKALDSIPAEQQQAIYSRWIPVSVEGVVMPPLNLDKRVRELIAATVPSAQDPIEVTAVIPRVAPPDYHLDREGRPGGFAIEVMELVARRANLRVRYRVEEDWERILEALRAGHADLIPNVGITESRRAHFAFTDPFETFRVSLFVRRDTHDIRGVPDLTGRRVAVVRANVGEQLLQSHSNIRLERYTDFPDALIALLSGNVDALVYPEPWAWSRARAARLGDVIKTVGDPLIEIKRALAVRADNRALLARLEPAVRDMLASPEFREIYTRWIGTPTPFWTPTRLGWVAGVTLILTVLAMGAWRYHSVTRAYRALQAAKREQDRTETRRRTIFETAAVSLWEEDISEVRQLLETHRPYVNADWSRYLYDHPELVTACARALRVVDVNLATLRLYEAESVEELLGSIDRIFTDESYDTFKQELVAIAEDRRHFIAEANNKTLKGRRFDILVSISIPPAESSNQTLVAAVLDVTDRKRAEVELARSEARASIALNAADMGSWEWDLEANHVVWSDNVEDIFRMPKGSFRGTYEAFLERVNPEDRERVRTAVTETLNNKEIYRSEYRITTPTGEIRWLISFGRGFYDVHGKALRMAGTVWDVTERKQAEAERERLMRELELRNAEMEGFVYTISHDLKAPLITIDGFAKILTKDLERGDKERGRESVGEIRKATNGMNLLIEDLLLLSRTGRITNEPEDVDLHDLMKDVQARCASLIDREHATIRIVTPLPRLHVDRTRFGQVLQNLLDNAVKFHRDGVPPEVEIGCDIADGQWRLYVRDNGIGIEKRYHEKIFGLFQRLDTRREGTGVGLTITKRIVEQHRGRLWVESEPGQGATFWISLPDSVIVSFNPRLSAREGRS